MLFVSATQLAAHPPTLGHPHDDGRVLRMCVCMGCHTHILPGSKQQPIHTHTHTKGKEELRNHSTQYSHFIRHFAVTTPITLARGLVRGGRSTTIAKPNDVVEGVTPKRRKETREMAENSPQMGNLPQKKDRLPGSQATQSGVAKFRDGLR